MLVIGESAAYVMASTSVILQAIVKRTQGIQQAEGFGDTLKDKTQQNAVLVGQTTAGASVRSVASRVAQEVAFFRLPENRTAQDWLPLYASSADHAFNWPFSLLHALSWILRARRAPRHRGWLRFRLGRFWQRSATHQSGRHFR